MRVVEQPKSLNVLLAPCGAVGLAALQGWSYAPEMQEFFRHFPPRFEWLASPGFLEAMRTSCLEIYNDKEFCGLFYLSDYQPVSKSIAIAGIGSCTERSAVAAEATAQLVAYLTSEKGVERITCKVLAHRKQLLANMQALGFEIEGTLRRSSRMGDEVLLAKIKE